MNPRCVELLYGRVLTVWRGSTAYVILSDADGHPVWPAPDGAYLGPDSSTVLQPILCRLSENAAVEAHSYRRSGANELRVVSSIIWNQPGAPPESLGIQVGSTPQDGISRMVSALVRRDDEHALMLVTEGSPVSHVRISQVAVPGAASTAWPPGGAVLSDSLSLIALGACPDAEAGCFLLARAWHSCVPSPFQVCPMELRLYHLREDGSPYPAWPTNGYMLSDHATWIADEQLVSDGQGGAYAAWWEIVNDSLRVVGKRVLPDGRLAPGWDPEGIVLLHSPWWSEEEFRIGASPSGQLVAMISTNGHMAPYVMARSAAGEVAPGWPAQGVALTSATVAGGDFLTQAYDLTTAPDGRIIAAWSEFDDMSGRSSLRVSALDPLGNLLPGWPNGGTAICAESVADLSLTMLSADDFAIVWEASDIRLGAFHLADATTPTVASAVLIAHEVAGSRLMSTWRLDTRANIVPGAMRSIDGSPFSPITTLRRVGLDRLVLTDSLPAAISGIRYAITAELAGRRWTISDLLEIAVEPAPGSRMTLICPTPQTGGSIEFEIVGGLERGLVPISLYDVAGRCVSRTTIESRGASRVHGSMHWGSGAPGLYVLEARPTVGERVLRRLLLIR